MYSKKYTKNSNYKAYNLLKESFKKIFYKFFFLIISFFLRSNLPIFKKIIFETYKKKSKYVLLDNEKEKYLLFTKDDVVSKNVFIENGFDLKKLYYVLEILKDNYSINKIYDIGANIGSICIPAVKRGLVDTAIAVEPEPENFKLLNLNIILNNLSEKITIHNCALSFEENNALELELSENNSGDHRIRLLDTKKGVDNEKDRKTVKVNSKTFDSLFPSIDPKKNLIWMDTQGFEANILLGAKKLISSGAPIVLEFWPYGLKLNNSFEKMKELLKNFKSFYDLSDKSSKIQTINETNINNLFSGWEEQKPGKDALFTDLLLLSD